MWDTRRGYRFRAAGDWTGTTKLEFSTVTLEHPVRAWAIMRGNRSLSAPV